MFVKNKKRPIFKIAGKSVRVKLSLLPPTGGCLCTILRLAITGCFFLFYKSLKSPK